MKMSERKDCNFIIGDGPRDLARLRCSAISYFVRNAIPFSTPAEDPYHDARMAPGIRILGLKESQTTCPALGRVPTRSGFAASQKAGPGFKIEEVELLP